jgi:hypothetical protein
LKLDPGETTCSVVKRARSAPIVASHCGLDRRANSCGAAAPRKRGSSHMLIASVAYAMLTATTAALGLRPKTPVSARVTISATPIAARAAMKAP